MTNRFRGALFWGKRFCLPAAVLVLAGTLLGGSPTTGQSQVFQRWVARVDVVHSMDQVAAITSDRQHNILVAGSICAAVMAGAPTQCQTSELQVEKYDINGNRLWGASLSDAVSATAKAITTDAEGNVYVTGQGDVKAEPLNDETRFITVKYSATGQRQWIAYYDAGQDGVGGGAAIAVDAEGNSYVTGSTGNGFLGPDVTIKYDPNGKQLWAASFSANQTNFPSGLVVDKSNDVYITGTGGDNGVLIEVGYTVKYDTNGHQLWSDIYLPPGDFQLSTFSNNAITIDEEENVYVGGEGAQSNNPSAFGPLVAYVIKYGPAGNRAWVARHQTPGGAADAISALAVDSHGNVYATGHVNRTTTFPPVSDYSTLKFSSCGTLLWQRRYNNTGSGSDVAFSLGVNTHGDIYVTGQSTSSSGNGLDFATLKYDANGSQLWAVRYDGPGHQDDTPVGLTLDGGDVVVAGSSVGSGTGLDWATVAYVQDAAMLTPASLAFASQPLGTTSLAHTVVLKNTAETILYIAGIGVTGDFSETSNCPAALAPMDTCAITVTFHPSGTGTRKGTLTISDDWAGSPRVAQLTGTGVAAH